ncbi:MAG: MarR family transcriptional regulator [Spirochaetales bacterium]|nr:MarR family transcriptional regulator [Spirochaetales bacterium]
MTGTDLSENVIASLRQIIRSVDLHSRKLAKEHGLTGPQLLILKEISKKEGITVGEIARGASLSQATVTSILDRLVKLDMVSREKSARDKRRTEVRLTGKSRELLSRKMSLLQDDFIEEFEALKEWEKQMLLSSLTRIAAMMGAEKIVSPPILMSGPIDASANDLAAYYDESSK